MSLFTDASLVYVPSGVKDGKTYSIVPTDGSGDLTFSRGSDIEATRIGADGLIHKAQVNLLLQSNTFSSATWVKGGSLTSGQSGYDGSSNAWLYTTTAAGQRIEQSTTITGVQTISVYAKAGNLDWILLNIGGGVFGAYFDLANGVVGSTQSASGGVTIDTKIQAIGSGWYRISVSGNYSSASSFRIYTASADLVTAAGTVYIQDAQLNYGLVAQTYQETTTAAVVSGITDNMPRLSYDPANPTCPHLILEPSRVNEVFDSENFSSATWQNVGTTVTPNAAISPEGVQNAFLLVSSGGGSARIQDYFGSLTGVRTASIFVKSTGTATRLNLQTNDVGGATFTIPASGAPTLYAQGTNVGTPFIEDYGSGWYRVGFSFNPTGGATNSYFQIYPDSANNLSSVYAYGAQWEAGSYPTSYIPTYGSSATRTAETSYQGLAAGIFTSAEGVWFFQVKDMKFDITGTGVGSMNLSVSNNLNTSIEVVQDGNDMFKITLDGSAAVQDLDGEKKVAIAWGSFGIKIYVDGVALYTNSLTTWTRQYNYFDLSRPTREWSGLMKQLIFFPSALSDSELATLTA